MFSVCSYPTSSQAFQTEIDFWQLKRIFSFVLRISGANLVVILFFLKVLPLELKYQFKMKSYHIKRLQFHTIFSCFSTPHNISISFSALYLQTGACSLSARVLVFCTWRKAIYGRFAYTDILLHYYVCIILYCPTLKPNKFCEKLKTITRAIKIKKPW